VVRSLHGRRPQCFQEAATVGADPDEVIDDFAEIWNELKAEYS